MPKYAILRIEGFGQKKVPYPGGVTIRHQVPLPFAHEVTEVRDPFNIKLPFCTFVFRVVGQKVVRGELVAVCNFIGFT